MVSQIAIKNIAPERTIYQIIENFKEIGSSAEKKASVNVPECPASTRTISWMSPPVQSLFNISSSGFEWDQDLLEKDSKEATPRKTPRTEFLQEVDCRRLVQSYFLWLSLLLTVWDIWEINWKQASMDALMCEEGNLVLNPGGDGEQVELVENGGNVLMFPHSHQHPSCTEDSF